MPEGEGLTRKEVWKSGLPESPQGHSRNTRKKSSARNGGDKAVAYITLLGSGLVLLICFRGSF